MENISNLQESALVVLGGLVTETNAANLPAGAAPVCCDADFTVQSVFSRDGLQNVYGVGPQTQTEGGPNLIGGVGNPTSSVSQSLPPFTGGNPTHTSPGLSSVGADTGDNKIIFSIDAPLHIGDIFFFSMVCDSTGPSSQSCGFVQITAPPTDSLGNVWNALAPSNCTFYQDSGGNPFATTLQVFYTVVTVPFAGFPSPYSLTFLSSTNPAFDSTNNQHYLASGEIWSNLGTLDQVSNGSHSVFSAANGPAITIAQPEVVLAFIGFSTKSPIPPAGFIQTSTYAGSTNQAIYCYEDSFGSFVAPPGTYQPTWNLITGGLNPGNPASTNFVTASFIAGQVDGAGWTNPGNVASGLTSCVTLGSSDHSEALRVSGFGFTVPSNATIQGIAITLTGTQSSTSGFSLVSDNFSRADGPLGANWTTPSWASPIQIVSDAAEPTVLAPDSCAGLYTGISWLDNQYSEITVGGIAGGVYIVLVRCDTATLTTYQAVYNSGTIVLYRYVGGTATLLETIPVSIFAPGDVMRLSAVNSILTVSVNGAVVGTPFTDETPIVSGLPGFQFYQFGFLSGSIVSNWSGGTFPIVNVTPIGEMGASETLQLSVSGDTVTVGSSTDLWGLTWTPAQINSPGFGFDITVSDTSGAATTFCVSQPIVQVWYSEAPAIFDWIGTFAQTDGEILTLALDADGIFWQEDVLGNPNVLTPFYDEIEPNTFAVGITEDNREFIALSDLLQGTDMPRQYNGEWVDRVSQVGPAVPPQISFNAAAVSNTEFPITSISQAAPTQFNIHGGGGAILWGAGPEQRTTGNVVTFYADLGNSWPGIYVGATIVIAGFAGDPLDLLNSVPVTNPYYTVTSVGTAIGSGGHLYNIFTIIAPEAANHDLFDSGTATYQVQLATVVTSNPVPNLGVGGQMTIAGVTPSTWDGSWTVLFTPNESQLLVVSTSLSGNVASYTFVLISGSLPTVGQQVTVTGTTNGNGIFNVANASVSAVTSTTFSIPIISPDIMVAGESATAIINGTIFQFDPLQLIAPGSGGDLIVSSSSGIGAGIRGAVCMFKTRNGYITAPSPQLIFTVAEGITTISASQIPIGPPNVVARIIAFTGAGGATITGGGGFYYWIPTPVTVINNGQQVTYTPTIINDNTSTQATFTFTDAVLLAAAGISIDGNNLFNQIELGSSLGFIAYAERLFAWGEQNKVQNLLNFSFDGGVGTINPVPGSTAPSISYPLGWTIDPSSGSGGSLTVSPLFGNSYYIQNKSGGIQSVWGMITQPAYQDSYKVPIIETTTPYSIRVTASSPSLAASGNLVVDLYSPSLNKAWGSFSVPLSSMTARMQIFTGTLLVNQFALVPTDLVIRIYATQIPQNGDVLLDRIEPYPTLNPVLTTQLRASYAENFEAFDQITGNLGATQNQQPILNAFELFDNLYLVKTHSLYSTADNGTTEPNFWNVREVSNKVGTCSIHGVDVGEGWALMVSEAGLYLFAGGDPVKISPELDGDPGLWGSINWKYGHTIWLKNNTETRHIYIGVPLATPNQWMPRFPLNANPTQPNVVLVCNYKELMTSGALESEGPLRITYTGELKSFSFGRKWSTWSIEACFAEFITRGDTTQPLFYLGDTEAGGIFQQITGLHTDAIGDGPIFNYFTFGFVKSQEAEQKESMGLGQLEAVYSTHLVRGGGEMAVTVYPDSIFSADAEALYPEPLADPLPYGDVELPLNFVGNRFFLEYSLQGDDAWIEIGRVVMWVKQSAWSPVRGSNS